jgi:hypothetical protein
MEVPTFEMPALNVDSIIKEDATNNGLRGFKFAHTFNTEIRKKTNFKKTVMPDGTRVWYATIFSKGAFSINLLLTNFELPENGRLFVYSKDHTHVIGSFDHRNNSPQRILPLRPVEGDSITVEYSEPANATFEGDFTITAVNHDYRNIIRREPEIDTASSYACMTDALCSDADISLVRSNVLLIIDGSTACSGVLVNNTSNNGQPYILTAVHCLNESLSDGKYKNNDYYTTKAGTVVAFFNYNRPVCGSLMKGTEEMSLSVAVPRAIMERKDIALIEMQEKPPVWFNAYYAGWNVNNTISEGPYTNLHHPSAAVTKHGITAEKINMETFMPGVFDSDSHLQVPAWTEGSTHAGSSGSPLFDRYNRIIGTLTAGKSECENSSPNGKADYFTALHKSWNPTGYTSNLKTFLDPSNTGLLKIDGYDPNLEKSLIRMTNINLKDVSLITSKLNDTDYIFGKNSRNAGEFAESFYSQDTIDILGVYLLIPSLPSDNVTDVEISLYSGEDVPDVLLATQSFQPRYTRYDTQNGSFPTASKNLHSVATESFVLFDEPVSVHGQFFISYKTGGHSPAIFCVYNTKASDTRWNTAFIKTSGDQWIPALQFASSPLTTSLAVQVLARRKQNSEQPVFDGLKIVFNREHRQLYLTGTEFYPSRVGIYSLSGTLLEKIDIDTENKPVILSYRPKGTIAIAHVEGRNKRCSAKIIY